MIDELNLDLKMYTNSKLKILEMNHELDLDLNKRANLRIER